MSEALTTHEEWNAGHLACGELVIELRKRLRKMPGEVIKVTALDPAAPIDIGAWCNMTGNTVINMDWDTREFWIRSKTTW